MDRKCICPVCQRKNTIGVLCLMVKKNRRLPEIGADDGTHTKVPETRQTKLRHYTIGLNPTTIRKLTWDYPSQEKETTIKRRSR